MSQTREPLTGLQRLVDILKRNGVDTAPRPAFPGAPRVGDLLLGAPMDPLLASFYARCDGGLFGDLQMLGFGTERQAIGAWNESLRESRQDVHPQLASCIEFGKEAGAPHYLATVPSLANPAGVQPVVMIIQYVDLSIYPIASSVDKVFDLWARFSDLRFSRYGRLDVYMLDVLDCHLWREHRLLAEDEELVRMLEAGRFEQLVGDETDRSEWTQLVIRTTRSR